MSIDPKVAEILSGAIKPDMRPTLEATIASFEVGHAVGMEQAAKIDPHGLSGAVWTAMVLGHAWLEARVRIAELEVEVALLRTSPPAVDLT